MRNKRIASAMACCAAWIISAQPAAGGIVILSGDSTPAFSLTDTLPDPAVAGNRQFFANVLGAGTNVAVLASSYSGADSEINEFYSSLPGKASTLLAGTITSGQLVGQQLLVLPVPDHDFTSVEAACIQSFCAAGGSVFSSAKPTQPPSLSVPRPIRASMACCR